MEGKSRIRLYLFCIYLILSFGCAGLQSKDDVPDLNNRVGQLEGKLGDLQADFLRVGLLERKLLEVEEESLMDMAAGVGAATRMYGRDCQTTTGHLTSCAKSLDTIPDTLIQDGDLALVVDSNGDIFIYRFDDSSTSAELYPWIIQPNDAGGNGDWILSRGISFKNDGSASSSVRFYEEYANGQNYYEQTVPASIGANQVFTVGQWRVDSSTLVDPSGNVDLEVHDTKTLFIIEEDGIAADRTATLPAATGSGVIYGFTLYQDGGTYEVFIDPDGTDQILLTTGAGEYVYGENATGEGHMLVLVDCMSGFWCPQFSDTDDDFAAAGNWQEQ